MVFSTRIAGWERDSRWGERVKMKWRAPLGFLLEDGEGVKGNRPRFARRGGRGWAWEGVEVRGFQGLLVGDAVVGRSGEPRLFFSKGMAGGGGWRMGGEGGFSSSAKPREAGGRFCNMG